MLPILLLVFERGFLTVFIAVEFIEDFHKKNEEINGHLKNVRFECKNVQKIGIISTINT